MKLLTLMTFLACNFGSASYAFAADAVDAHVPAQGWLGIILEKLEQTPAQIKDVLENGPARAAGLQAGDWILAVEAESTERMSLEEIVSRLRGPVGTPVTLTVLSGEDQADLTIIRAEPTL